MDSKCQTMWNIERQTLSMQSQTCDNITPNDHAFDLIIQFLCCYYNILLYEVARYYML